MPRVHYHLKNFQSSDLNTYQNLLKVTVLPKRNSITLGVQSRVNPKLKFLKELVYSWVKIDLSLSLFDWGI